MKIYFTYLDLLAGIFRDDNKTSRARIDNRAEEFINELVNLYSNDGREKLMLYKLKKIVLYFQPLEDNYSKTLKRR